jgi:hypothetical protein
MRRTRSPHVRFAPKADKEAGIALSPLSAKIGLVHRNKRRRVLGGYMGRGRSGSMARPKAIYKKPSAPETGTSAKWFGNIRVQ